MTNWIQCYALLDLTQVSDEDFNALVEMLGEIEETDSTIRDVDFGARAERACIDVAVDHDRCLGPLTYVYLLIEDARLTLKLPDIHTVVTSSPQNMFAWLNEGKLPHE